MNENCEIKIAEKEIPVLVNAKATELESPQNEIDLDPIFVIPSVPRPGKTSWSLVL